jgi:hypothetical protein
MQCEVMPILPLGLSHCILGSYAPGRVLHRLCGQSSSLLLYPDRLTLFAVPLLIFRFVLRQISAPYIQSHLIRRQCYAMCVLQTPI